MKNQFVLLMFLALTQLGCVQFPLVGDDAPKPKPVVKSSAPAPAPVVAEQIDETNAHRQADALDSELDREQKADSEAVKKGFLTWDGLTAASP